jgi:NAD(P)-dependent dehydrogenase (short-subunit alcohol dehydrogenase family)
MSSSDAGPQKIEKIMPSPTHDLASANLFSLAGKTAVLTGASGFLGRTFVRTLLANGARVVALGRSDRLQFEAEKWMSEFGESAIAVHQIDMYDTAALNHLLDQIAAEEKSVDILINNAHELGPGTGFNTPSGSLENATHDQWMRNLTGGVYWAVQTVQKLGVRMKQQQCGSIVNISTMYALVAPRPALYAGTESLNPPGYSASKAALSSFTRYVASYWGANNVRCNAILPGPFSNTEDVAGANSVAEDSPFIQRLKGYTCLNRIGRPNELSGALLFLASDASTFVTGQAIVVDGGWTAV